MKKLKIYKEPDAYVIERVNEFNHATKRYFGHDKEELIDALRTYPN